MMSTNLFCAFQEDTEQGAGDSWKRKPPTPNSAPTALTTLSNRETSLTQMGAEKGDKGRLMADADPDA